MGQILRVAYSSRALVQCRAYRMRDLCKLPMTISLSTSILHCQSLGDAEVANHEIIIFDCYDLKTSCTL